MCTFAIETVQMEQNKGLDALMEALGGALEVSPHDVLMARMDMQEKLLARSFMMALGGSLVALCLSVQSVFFTLKLTGVVQWAWWSVFLPTVAMFLAWYVINWVRKQQAKKMITRIQKDIDSMKEKFSSGQQTPEVEEALRAFNDMFGKKDS